MSKRVDPTKYHGKTVEELTKLHTGTLVNVLDASRMHRHCDCCGTTHKPEDIAFNDAQGDLMYKVRDLLMGREHIKNKAERKLDRQMAAKKGK